MSIREEFEKYNTYKVQMIENEKSIQKIMQELSDKEPSSSLDMFVYLQEVDELDLLKKKIASLRADNETMNEELENLPNTIRKELCESIHRHFAIVEHNKIASEKRIEALRIKRNKIIKTSSIITGIVMITFIVRRITQSRK